MRGVNNQVWVTSVLNDGEVKKALVLSYSLKRSLTSRLVAIIASPGISKNLRECLYYAFDLVFFLQEDMNSASLKPEDFARISVLAMMRSFNRCVYVSPDMLAVRNADEIFEKYGSNDEDEEEDELKKGGLKPELMGEFVFTSGMDLSIFLCKPSVTLYKALMDGMARSKTNGKPVDIAAYLKVWLKNQFKNKRAKDDTIADKYFRILESGSSFLGNEKDISIVKLNGIDPTRCEQAEMEKFGILGKGVLDKWRKICAMDVHPLLETSLSSPGIFHYEVSNSVSPYDREPIAVVGMSCRFPGSNNLEEFWNLLFATEDGTCEVPPFRWLREQCSHHRADCRKTNAGFLKVPVDEFDAKFFGVSPKEVLFMDPQHRLLHELVWEGLEDACIDAHSLKGTPAGVFIGSWLNEYKDILMASGTAEFYRTYMGNSIGAAAARISHLLELIGPAVATESGCSSAMVAVHMACRSLLLGESNLALACGVNMLFHPFDADVMPMVISPDGHCKTFDETANGFARAEGCGVLVLKRLSDAVKDGDRIWGLILGSAMSQEGISKSMGTPTVHCESQAMIQALRDGGVDPAEVSYVEAHGTGTVVGDPMEVAAIAKAYGSPRRKEPLFIGSVKTNVGHTESCSGITGIMKVILSMHHGYIPAHRNLDKLNPAVNLEAVPAKIPLEPVEWKASPGKKRLAGVSSFGITGTDAHVVVEESPKDILEECNSKLEVFKELGVGFERPLHILKLSGKTDEALDILLQKFEDALQDSSSELSQMSLADVCYAGNVGRASFPFRAAITAKTKEELLLSLQQKKYTKGKIASSAEEMGKICFLFTGQGSQYPGMAKTLYETSPVFRMHFDLCETIMRNTYRIGLKEVLWGGSSNREEISRTIYSQTSIFCVEYALLQQWRSWGVQPDFCVGHSLGEFAAAVCANILTVEDALKLVAERSRLIDQLSRGKMLVIKADKQQVASAMKRFGTALDYAALNSNEQTVVAGDSDVVLNFHSYLEKNGFKSLILDATHAFHSSHMDPMLEDYRKVAQTVKKPKLNSHCQFISGMKGDVVEASQVGPDYWVKHTREHVRFLKASKQAVELGCRIFVEVGPQPVLSALTMMNNDLQLHCFPSLKKTEEEWTTLLSSLGKLYVRGVSIDWNQFDQFYSRQKVRLPSYPFLGKKFWPDLMAVTGASIHPLVGSCVPNASSTKIYQCGVNLNSHEYIKDHAIGQTPVVPGAGYLEMCLAAGLATVENAVDSMSKPTRAMKVENLLIEAPLALQEGKTCQVQTVVDLNEDASASGDWNDMTVKIFHRVDAEATAPTWLSHARGIFSPLPTMEEQQPQKPFETETEFRKKIEEEEADEELLSQVYEKLANIGLKFGPIFQSLEKIWKKADGSTNILAKVKVPEKEGEGQGQYIIHPAVLDAMIQSVMMLRLTSNLKKKLYVPIKIDKFVWLAENETEETYIYAYDTKKSSGDDIMSTSDCVSFLLDGKGKVVAFMTGVEFIDTTVKAIEAVLEQQTITMPDLWEESWRVKLGPLQLPQNLVASNKEPCWDDKFYEDLMMKYNVLDPNLSETFEQLNKLVYYYIVQALHECGWKVGCGDFVTTEGLSSELGISTEYKFLFSYYLTVLEEEGILKRWENGYKLVHNLPSLDETVNILSSPTYGADLQNKFSVSILFHKLGKTLAKILQGKQPPLYILFPENPKKDNPGVGEFYEEYGTFFPIAKSGKTVGSHWLSFVKEKHGDSKFVIRVLEIGAGTGCYTGDFLEAVEELGIEVEYTYTDISTTFFPPAEKKFEKFSKSMKFKKLNIEEDPIAQGFVPGYYDYVCASDVIHATRNIRETLQNVNILMKPYGRFDMMEMTKVNRFITYIFGLLEGFWRFEDRDLRANHCTLPFEKWREVFLSAGFVSCHQFPSCNNYHALITSTKGPQLEFPRMIGSKSRNRSWLVFHQPDNKLSQSLMEKIQSLAGRSVIVVRPGAEFKVFDDDHIMVRPKCSSDFLSVMDMIGNDKEKMVEGVIYAWSLDTTSLSHDEILQPYFYLAQSIASLKQIPLPRLLALTSGVVPIENNDVSHFHQSILWGFTKSLRNENTELNCRIIDVGDDSTIELEVDDTMQIFYEIFNSDKETQVAYYQGAKYTPKFQSHKCQMSDLKLPSGTDRFQLILPETKSIADLQFGPLNALELGDFEVEIKVKASALNFRDVFSVLKPSEKFTNINAVGFDLAGVVKRVGHKVSKWSVGDSVFGVNVHGDALPSHVKLGEDDVLKVPDEMTYCEAATLPAVFATAYYCLIDVAKVSSKDTVLIHTASGGVGLSAIELCKHLGARIIATAGSKRKRNYLRSLGIQHIFHSRNTYYEKQILEVTGGRGVDVVLNSLTSEGFKEATLKTCAKNARFVEMSKLSIWEPDEVRKLRPDVDYRIVDVASIDKSEWQRLMKSLKQLAEERIIHPIPYVRFDGANIREALQYMQKAKHIGKVVCVMPEVKQSNAGSLAHSPMFNDRSTYLITGGLGGIGFVISQWMVEKGAKYILLAGRNPPSISMQQRIDKINSQQLTNVTAVQLDVGDFKQCKHLIEVKIAEMGFPHLRGVMHCAGTLSDGLIQNQDWVRFSSTLNTKVNGTLNLHELTKNNSQMEHFVLFSSIAALFGPPGQSNHAAGNNFEDAFAHYRNSIGLLATTVNWGQWGQVGVATEVDLPGLKPFSNLQAIAALEYAMKSQRVQTCAVNVQSFVLMSKLFPHISAYLDERVWKSGGGGGISSAVLILNSEEFWERYDSAENNEKRWEVVQEKLKSILRNILKMDDTDVIHDEQIFQDMGVDSLMFIEIKNSLQALLGDRVTVSASALRDCNNIKLLADTLVKLIEGDESLKEEMKPPSMEEVAELIKEDAQLPEHIRANLNQKRVSVRDIKSVLLTGATGTYGPYLLRELIQLPQISQVYCLVRQPKHQTMEERLRSILADREILQEMEGNMSKVTCVAGDVASKHLGLEPGLWDELADKIDSVIHAAASVQHIAHYKKLSSTSKNDMRLVNNQGTKNALEFACAGKKLKQFYHAGSLLSVAKLDETGVFSEDWPEPGDYDGTTTFAYPVTKFVGDLILKEAVLNRGIPGKVFRLPLIVGDSRNGNFSLSQNHFMLRYLFIMKTGIMPSNPWPMIMSPVDVLAKVSLGIFFNESCPDDVYNVIPKRVDIDQNFADMAERLGYPVEIVEFTEFSRKVMESADDSPFAIFKEFYRDENDIMSVYVNVPCLRNWMDDGGSGKVFWSPKMSKYASDFYDNPESSMDCVYRDLCFAKEKGWLEKFGL